MIAKSQVLLSVAPGVYINPLEREDFDPESEYVLLDEKGLRSLGVGPEQCKTLARLDHCGLIKIHSITPRRRLLDLATWRAHLEAVREDPEFWEKPHMRRRWRIACLAV